MHDVQDSLYTRAYGAHFELIGGHWDKAAEVATELIEHHTLSIARRVPALLVLALVRARRGDPRVDPLLDEALQLALQTGEFSASDRSPRPGRSLPGTAATCSASPLKRGSDSRRQPAVEIRGFPASSLTGDTAAIRRWRRPPPLPNPTDS